MCARAGQHAGLGLEDGAQQRGQPAQAAGWKAAAGALLPSTTPLPAHPPTHRCLASSTRRMKRSPPNWGSCGVVKAGRPGRVKQAGRAAGLGVRGLVVTGEWSMPTGNTGAQARSAQAAGISSRLGHGGRGEGRGHQADVAPAHNQVAMKHEHRPVGAQGGAEEAAGAPGCHRTLSAVPPST